MIYTASHPVQNQFLHFLSISIFPCLPLLHLLLLMQVAVPRPPLLPLFSLLCLHHLLLVLCNARREENRARDGPFQCCQSDNQPQQDDSNRKYRAEHFEEPTRDFLGQGARRHCKDTDRESEPPPAHIEGEFASRYTGKGKEQPYTAISPDYQGAHSTEAVNDPAALGPEVVGVGKDFRTYFAELHQAEATLSERSEREKDGDDHFPWRESMNGEAVEIHDQHNHCQREAGAPEDVGCDDRPDLMLRIW